MTSPSFDDMMRNASAQINAVGASNPSLNNSLVGTQDLLNGLSNLNISSLISLSPAVATPTFTPFPTTSSRFSSAAPSPQASKSNREDLTDVQKTVARSIGAVAIAGIVLGVIVVVVVIGVLVVIIRRQKTAPTTARSKLNQAGSDIEAPATTIMSTTPTDIDSNTYKRMQDSHSSTSAMTASGGMWDDPVIIAARVPMDRIQIGALLSRGGYGEVFHGVYRGTEVAVKRLLPGTSKDLKHINDFLAEIKLMASLEHDCIVRFVGVAWDALSDLSCIAEFMHGGDLRSLLSKWEHEEHRSRGLDHSKVRIAMHVTQALTYLHSLAPIVVHRDLKSKNVLLDSDFNAKLTDFGISRERSDATMTAGVGTCLWMAPEVMMGERYDEKADIFSFGVLLSELDTQQLPYAHAKTTKDGRMLPDAALLQMVSIGRLRVHFSEGTAETLKELGMACTEMNPSDRPTAPMAMYSLQTALRSLRL